MLVIDAISRVIHVGTAITLVGGSVFLLFVLLPAARELQTDAHDRLAAAVTGRWKRFVHVGITLFLLSGLYNYYRAIPLHRGDGPYYALLGTKMLLALGVFFIASALVGRSAVFEGMRRNRSRWLGILVLLAAAIVMISGYAKVRGLPAMVPEQAASTTP